MGPMTPDHRILRGIWTHASQVTKETIHQLLLKRFSFDGAVTEKKSKSEDNRRKMEIFLRNPQQIRKIKDMFFKNL